MSQLSVVCLSDTHGLHESLQIPEGDLLLHAGDFCGHGSEGEVRQFRHWLRRLPHRHKIVVAGNHDWPLDCFSNSHRANTANNVQRLEELFAKDGITYLRDRSLTIDGWNIYASPWQPEFYNWAFNLPRQGAQLLAKWQKIPDNTHILLTHGPPHGSLDCAPGGPAGCELLAARLKDLSQLRLHVFGHIHEGYGHHRTWGHHQVNASSCDVHYRPINPPIVIQLLKDQAQQSQTEG